MRFAAKTTRPAPDAGFPSGRLLAITAIAVAMSGIPVSAEPMDGPGSPQWQTLALEFPEGTHLTTSEHFLVVYDTPHAWAESRVNILERAYVTFYRAYRRAGFKLNSPPRRLVCIIFNRHGDFIGYAQRHNRLGLTWANGFYATDTNRIALFNFLNSPHLTDEVARIKALQAKMASLRQRIANTPPHARSVAGKLRGQLRGLERRWRQVKRRYQGTGGVNNVANTMHEAAHLLAFNSGLQSRRHGQPVWYSEGVATSFETINPAEPFGPGKRNPVRFKHFKEAARAGRLMGLDELVAARNAGDLDEGKRRVLYAQSWALYHYLFRHRTADLRRFGELVNAGPPGYRSEKQFREIFVEAFGPTDDLQEQFVETVLEENDRVSDRRKAKTR